jgi:hypothetical protein
MCRDTKERDTKTAWVFGTLPTRKGIWGVGFVRWMKAGQKERQWKNIEAENICVYLEPSIGWGNRERENSMNRKTMGGE